MNYINKIFSQFTMYGVALWVLRGLIAFSVVLSFFEVLPYTWWHIILSMLLFIGFCWGSNILFAYIFKVKTNFDSQFITAEILTLIVGPLHPFTDWWIIFLISFIAMGSKYIFVYGKNHIFNPAAFGVLASALIVQQGASWWIGGRYTLAFVALGSIIILYKLKWFHLALAFLFTYFGALTVSLVQQGNTNAVIWQAIQSSALDSPILFFTGIMLIEPLTAPRGKNWRIAYGVCIALVMVITPRLWPSYSYSIETSLLVGNLLTLFLTRKVPRQNLKLVEKKLEARDTYSFWFQPEKTFDFKPGQFLEWTLPHTKPDSRGIRRFFTVAASPTENRLRIITRMYPKPSTFKRALSKMKIGDTLSVSHLDGEFTLPKDLGEKLVFIAGGVGVAPYLSMFQYMIDKKISRDIILFNANKTAADIAFSDLDQKISEHGVKIIQILSEAPPETWAGKVGFLTPEIITSEVPDYKNRSYYISGPEPMVENYQGMLIKMGVPSNKIQRDYFPGYQ